jgi:hypothetical protein
MKDIALYNLEVEQTEGINGFTSIEIFSKGGTDEVWGHEDENCNPFSFSSLDASVDYSAISKDLEKIIDTVKIDIKYDLPVVKVKDTKGIEKNSIHLKTDKLLTCEWIGMGIGWDGWQGKDLSGILNNAAIEFMARVDGDAIYNIPIVFILEDYSANQCYATAGYLGIEGGEITNKWSKVIVPLSTFSYQTDNIDLTNIKQLLLQCYDKVDIFIDDIKIIEYKHNYKKISSSLAIKDTILPIDIFSEKLNSAFGINNNYCQNIKLTSDSDYTKGNYIDINIDNDKCSWNKLGISWNDWLYSDLSISIYGVYLEFDIKIERFSSPKVLIEDYNGKKMDVDLLRYIKAEKSNNWQKIRIPLKDFSIKKSEIDLKRIKNISFDFADKDKLKIDNIKLTN